MAARKKKEDGASKLPAVIKADLPDRLPDAVEAEQALLGAILLDNQCYWTVADFLADTHFTEQPHQLIFKIMGTMIAEGRPVTPITMKNYLPADVLIGNPETGQLTMFQYVQKLPGHAIGTDGKMVREQGRAVIEMWVCHQGIALCDDFRSLFRTMPINTTPDKVAMEMVTGLVKVIQEANTKKGAARYGLLLPKAVHRASTTQEKASIPWFLPEITSAVGDARPGNLIGLMSDSGGGKTSLALQQCRYAAIRGFKSAFFSIEITDEEAALQTAAQAAGIELGRLDSYSLDEKERAKLEQELERSMNLPYDIVQFADAKLTDIRTRAEAMKNEEGLDQLVIDHAKMIALPGRPGELFAERVMALYRGLKIIAKALEMAVVILIQRNEDWKNRVLKGGSLRPMMGDAYGGGSVRQTLDAWFSLYRPEPLYRELIHQEMKQEKRDSLIQRYEKSKGKAWIINHKRRRGESGAALEILFEAQYTRFVSPNATNVAPAFEGFEGFDG